MGSIDDDVDNLFKNDNPTGEAVKSLITVGKRTKGESSEVELKTDLTADEVKLHTILESLGIILESKEKKFNSECFLLNIVEKKERKSLSKDRQSRNEIVQVARQPDQMLMPGEHQNTNALKRFFTSKRNRDING